MYKATFKTTELKAFLESGLGFAVKLPVRLGGGGAVNFKVERVSDHLEFLVKCFVPERKANYDRLVSNLKTLEGAKGPLRLFETACPKTFGSYHVLCLAWRHGETSDPSQMSDRQWANFLNDYLVFADRMQHAEAAVESAMPLETWREKALGLCKGLSGRVLRSALSPLVGVDLTVRREDLRVVHGDFHTGNVLFCDGEVECFMDVENLTLKYAPADILLYCVYAARRLHGVERQRVWQRFGEAVRQLPFSGHEWQKAINAAILSGLNRRTNGFRKCGLLAAIKNAAEVRFYEPFRQQVAQNADI